ncbi:uncharacterized protein [Primulina huaijiensis]|uniref:uncharacterized protein n=1 Tax=Primulina huaijiensis TaxID=1492673 RepID=UPI003CC78BF5
MVKHGLATRTSSEEKSDILEPNPNPSNNSLLITHHRLIGPNYLQWSKFVRMLFCGRGKEEYLTGEIEAPAKTDVGYKKWNTENQLIMSWLINSMSLEVGENFLLYETAKDVWEVVRETYSSSNNTSELSAIESALHDLRQGKLSVTQYYNALTKQWQQLDVFETHAWKCMEDGLRYRKIVEQKRTFKFLLGLNKELDDVRGRVMSVKPFLGLREAFAEIRREESRKKVMMGPPPTSVDGCALLGSSLGATTRATQQERRKSQPTNHVCNLSAKCYWI